MDLTKSLFPRSRAPERKSNLNDEMLRRLASPNEVMQRPQATISPEPGKDPAREAAMNFVRQMKIYQR